MPVRRYFHIEEAAAAVIVHISEPHLCGDVVGEVLRLELSEIINKTRPQRLLIDLGLVTMISSSVIAALLSTKRKLDQYGAAADAVRDAGIDPRDLPHVAVGAKRIRSPQFGCRALAERTSLPGVGRSDVANGQPVGAPIQDVHRWRTTEVNTA